MSGGFEYFDIILFAMIAAFLVYRLGSVLGKRTGHERQGREPFGKVGGREPAESGNDNVVTMPRREPLSIEEREETRSPLGAAITQIKVVDPGFSRESFLKGAGGAFEMIISAFAGGDLNTLRGLLSPEVYEKFAAAIRAREQAGETRETTLVSIDEVEIVDARLDHGIAYVTVRYASQQVNVTRDAAGKVIDGDPNTIEKINDLWTFSRDTRSANPNWLLVATQSAED